jgi:hypothetical protein
MFNFLKKKDKADNLRKIIGTWRIDSKDSVSFNEYGDSSMRFKETGELDYISHGQDKDQIAKLTFSIDDKTITTNQPSQPREEKTPYSVNGQELILSQNGKKIRYLKQA